MPVKFLLRVILLLITGIFLVSCGSSRSRIVSRKDHTVEKPRTNDYDHNPTLEANELAHQIVKNAKKYEGTRYKYGGIDKKGMDCSGLIYVSFLEEGFSLPRTSRAMSLQGKRLYLKEVTAGDLLFFETNKNKKVINHVGLVVEVNDQGIYFIHSSSSSGVIISSLSETYWYNNFIMARRVI